MNTLTLSNVRARVAQAIERWQNSRPSSRRTDLECFGRLAPQTAPLSAAQVNAAMRRWR